LTLTLAGLSVYIYNASDENATGIEAWSPSVSPKGERTEASPLGNLDGAAYDLVGRQMVNGKWLNGKSHGIRIVEGKKILK